MKKALIEIITATVGIFIYYLGDVATRWVTGKNEFPKYYWIIVGLMLAYQIIRDINEIKNKLEK